MIYLVEDRDYLKIGFTDDLDERKKHYDTYNCYYKILNVHEGTRRDETFLHQQCKPYQFHNEWLYNVKEVKNIYFNYIKALDKKSKSYYIQSINYRNMVFDHIVSWASCKSKRDTFFKNKQFDIYEQPKFVTEDDINLYNNQMLCLEHIRNKQEIKNPIKISPTKNITIEKHLNGIKLIITDTKTEERFEIFKYPESRKYKK